MELGNGTASDRISGSGAATANGTNAVNINVVFGNSVAAGTSYTLVSASSGLNAANFALGTKPASLNFTRLNLSTPTPTAILLTATGNATPAVAYWTGDGSTASGDAANNSGAGMESTIAIGPPMPRKYRPPCDFLAQQTSVIFTAANTSGSGGI